MSLDEISIVLASAATILKKPLEGTVSKVFLDAYDALKAKISMQSKDSSEVDSAIKALEKKPDSSGRRLTLVEELDDSGVQVSDELLEAVRQLQAVVQNISEDSGGTNISVKQSGRGNSVQIAGRDIIQTKKVVRRNHFQTDERHIDGKQAMKIRDLVRTVAERLANEKGEPNFPAAYGKLTRKMGVPSYKEIRREDFDEAVSYLRQLAAQNRSKLKKSNPTAYSNSLYAAIYAKWTELGHEKSDIYEFAENQLAIKRKIGSLKHLGPNQLKWLNEKLDVEIARKRRLTTD
jgi:hypothetical protein